MAASAESARVMVDPPLEVRRLARSDWALLRAVRLRALRDSPRAFTSTYAQEATDGEEEWRRRFDGADWVMAVDHGRAIGLACLVCARETGDARYIESVWVAPGHRRRGVFRSMMGGLAEIGRAAQIDTLLLWVVGDNHGAFRAYTRLGFVPTGRIQPLDAGTGRVERQLRLGVRT